MDKRLLLRDRKGNSDSQFLITTNINGFDGIWTDIGIKIRLGHMWTVIVRKPWAQRVPREKPPEIRLDEQVA
jgi:hypothetical protein